MNHEMILKAALAGLPAERAGYFTDLGKFIEAEEKFEAHRHWMLLLLAHGVELIPLVLSKQDAAVILSRYVTRHLVAIQKAAYSPEYVTRHGAPLAEMVMELANEFSEIGFDALRDGKLQTGAKPGYTFRWPYTDDTVFPYTDDEEDEW